MIPSILELIKDNKVYFQKFRAGVFYYSLSHTDKIYTFPVPLSDIGDATMLGSDKAIMFMRYIRKSISDNTICITSNF